MVDVRTGSFVNYAARTNTLIVAPPVIQDDDLLFLFWDGVINGPTPPTPAQPAGFGLLPGFPVNRNDGAGFTADTYIWTKLAAGESGDYQVNHSACNSDAFMLPVFGQDLLNPFNPAFTLNQGAGLISTAPGLTTLIDGTLIIYWVSQWNFPGIVPPGGATPTLTTRLDGSVTLFFVSTGVMSPVGATGDKTANLPHTPPDPWGSGLFAIAPAVAPPVVPSSAAFARGDGSGV